MESWFKLIAAVFVGGMALFFHPWLESAYNSATPALGISGQPVAFIWLLFNFAWAFVGTLIGYSVAAVVLFYLAPRPRVQPDPFSRKLP